MSEYNIQMNKYNALNAEYDQLYPATKIENVDGLNTALQNKTEITSIWRNAAPTSNFPNQFLNIDVSKYSAIIVNCNRSTGVTGIYSSVLLPVYDGSAGCVWDAISNGEKYRTFIIHNAGTTDVGIDFNACTEENFGIPIQIFGLKNLS